MSLDVYLACDCCKREFFSGNITHNLIDMAEKAGLYTYLWHPEDLNITKADQLIGPLTVGLSTLKSTPLAFKEYNPKNGWGTYEGFVRFVEEYLEACKQNKNASVRVSR